MEDKKLLELIEQFIAYGKKKLALNEIDALAAKNYLYAEFDIYPSDDVNISFFTATIPTGLVYYFGMKHMKSCENFRKGTTLEK